MCFNTTEGYSALLFVVIIFFVRFRDLLKDANAKNLFYFDKGLCEAATLSDDKLTASIEGCSDDCILLAHRGMTSGCYTFRGTRLFCGEADYL